MKGANTAIIPPNSFPAKKKPLTPISSSSSPYDGIPYPINPAITLKAIIIHAIIIAVCALGTVFKGKVAREKRRYMYKNIRDKNLENSSNGVRMSVFIKERCIK